MGTCERGTNRARSEKDVPVSKSVVFYTGHILILSILRNERQGGRVDNYRNWKLYTEGFGSFIFEISIQRTLFQSRNQAPATPARNIISFDIDT